MIESVITYSIIKLDMKYSVFEYLVTVYSATESVNDCLVIKLVLNYSYLIIH